MYVDIKKEVGNNVSSREEGKIVRKIIEDNWNSEDKITIDFKDMEIASVSFIDEAFALLLTDHSIEEMKEKLSFINILNADRKLLNYMLNLRIQEFSLKGVE